MDLWQQHMTLWQETSRKMMGQSAAKVAEPERGDRRFKSADWMNTVCLTSSGSPI